MLVAKVVQKGRFPRWGRKVIFGFQFPVVKCKFFSFSIHMRANPVRIRTVSWPSNGLSKLNPRHKGHITKAYGPSCRHNVAIMSLYSIYKCRFGFYSIWKCVLSRLFDSISFVFVFMRCYNFRFCF